MLVVVVRVVVVRVVVLEVVLEVVHGVRNE